MSTHEPVEKYQRLLSDFANRVQVKAILDDLELHSLLFTGNDA